MRIYSQPKRSLSTIYRGAEKTESIQEYLTAHQEFWYDSGDIVLISENGRPGGRAFKVHREHLTGYSFPFLMDWFRYLHSGLREVNGGIPVILLDDSTADVVFLLASLYYPGWKNSIFNRGQPVPVDVIETMLRIYRKYGIDILREEAFYRLKMYLPKSLNELDDLLLVYDSNSSRRISGLDRFDPVRLVNLARRYDLDHLLAMAFYLCCQIDPILLASSRSRDPNTLLSNKDLRICLIGRKRLQQINAVATRWLFSNIPRRHCTYYPPFSHRKRLNWDCHPLRPSTWFESAELNMCAACLKDVRSMFDNMRTLVWQDLHIVFDPSPEPWAQSVWRRPEASMKKL
ncbi:unnamed protein product [Somion occarium]|uniref:BTB domain-containing protein n=1 Tax=Somion occarium TaxID=3059160 RepID=A0ABP1EBQ2_9APHY